MKLTVNRQALLDELRLICPSIARHEITPICLCVRITTNESIATGEIKLVLDSVSNDRQFTAVIDADVTDAGSCAIEARRMHDILRFRVEESVTIRTDGEWCVIECGSFSARLYTISTETWPVIPELEKPVEVTIPGQVINDAIRHVMPYVATDDSRYGLNCAFMERAREDGMIRIVATDGHRLMVYRTGIEVPATMPDVLIPRASAAMIGVISRTSPNITIEAGIVDRFEQAIDKKTGIRPPPTLIYGVLVSAGHRRMYVRCDSADFPDYRQVIPTKQPYRITLSRHALTRFCQMAMRMKARLSPVAMTINTDSVDCETSAPDVGSIRDHIPASVAGKVPKGLRSGVNASYLLDAIRVIPGDLVTIGLRDPLGAVTIEDDRFIVAIMPVRL